MRGGDTDNGFGLLYNWNRLGDGVHTVTAYADSVEFTSVQVIVTTLGEEFLQDANGIVTIPDFPDPGMTRMLRWQQAQQNFVITAGSPQGGGTSGAVPHVLENPQPGSFQSGVGIISGWACNAQTIEISIDGGPRIQAGTGTIREDTQGVCGDTDNGFGLLYNWNRLGDGPHTVTAYADGGEFAHVTVTVTTLGEEFRQGLSREVTIPNFPEVGTDAILQWQEAQQNFVISFAAPTARLVTVEPSVRLPSGLSIPNLVISSLMSETAEVRARPEPTLVLAEDAGGVVLLALASMDGGFLGERPGEVEVSVDSTAVALVGLAAGIAVPDMVQRIADVIRRHSQYPALVAALTERLAADPNFLDGLIDDPETERLIEEVAAELTISFIPQSASAWQDIPPLTPTAYPSSSRSPFMSAQSSAQTESMCSDTRENINLELGIDFFKYTGAPVDGLSKLLGIASGIGDVTEATNQCLERKRCEYKEKFGDTPPKFDPISISKWVSRMLKSNAPFAASDNYQRVKWIEREARKCEGVKLADFGALALEEVTGAALVILKLKRFGRWILNTWEAYKLDAKVREILRRPEVRECGFTEGDFTIGGGGDGAGGTSGGADLSCEPPPPPGECPPNTKRYGDKCIPYCPAKEECCFAQDPDNGHYYTDYFNEPRWRRHCFNLEFYGFDRKTVCDGLDRNDPLSDVRPCTSRFKSNLTFGGN